MFIDPSQYQVEISQLQVKNEELLAYMNPTMLQKQQLRENGLRIAFLALKINDYYKSA